MVKIYINIKELRKELKAINNNLCEDDIHLCISKAIERASAISDVLKEDSGTREDRVRELAHVCAEALKTYRLNDKGERSQGKSAFLNRCLDNRAANAYRDANADKRRINSEKCSFPVEEIGYGMSSKDYHDEKLALQDRENISDSRKNKKNKRPSCKSSVTGKEICCRVGERDCEDPYAPYINKPEREEWNFYTEIDYELIRKIIHKLNLEDNLLEFRYIYELASELLPDEILHILKEKEDNQGKLPMEKKEKARELLHGKSNNRTINCSYSKKVVKEVYGGR